MKKTPSFYGYRLKLLLWYEQALYALLTALMVPASLLVAFFPVPTELFEKYKVTAGSSILFMLAFSLLCFSLECQAHEDYRRRHEDE